MRVIYFVFGGLGILIIVSAVVFVLRNKHSGGLSQIASAQVTWQLKEGGVWVPTALPPPCPEPLVVMTPVDISQVSGILVPGQPRGGAWKPHGGFHFIHQSNNQVIVKVPMDAELVRGAHLMLNGEHQYGFEFIAPCGIWYSFGHLLELSPKFQAIADHLPLVVGMQKQQHFDVTPPVAVTTGEIIATAVGYAKTKNVMVDWGVLDLRQKNGATLRPEWAKYAPEFDEHAICWIDILPADDRARLRGIFGSGDSETGVQSDYCHYPENR